MQTTELTDCPEIYILRMLAGVRTPGIPTFGRDQGWKAGFGYLVSGWAPWSTQDPLSNKQKQIQMLLSGGVAHTYYPST